MCAAAVGQRLLSLRPAYEALPVGHYHPTSTRSNEHHGRIAPPHRGYAHLDTPSAGPTLTASTCHVSERGRVFMDVTHARSIPRLTPNRVANRYSSRSG